MNGKKYQVFISSTYTDLIEERKKVVDAVLIANSIPAGMEAFSATDESQFDVIKKVIDLCDYYVLIIANRYGSIFPGKEISYTEMEYEYALSKEIPVLAFIVDGSVGCDKYPNDDDELLKSKLVLFKKRVSSNRLVKYWKSKDELYGQVISSLYNAFSGFERPGWTRGGLFDESTLLEEIQTLRDENKSLKKLIQDSNNKEENEYEKIEFPMHYSETVYVFSSSTIIQEKDINATLGDLFKHVSLSLTSECLYHAFSKAVNDFVPGFHTSDTTIKKLKGQFLIYGLIEEENRIINKNQELCIRLTEYGRKEMKRLNKYNNC